MNAFERTKTMPFKIKMKVAEWLNARHSEYCWARLVMWAYGYESTWDMFGLEHLVDDQTCRHGFAWCGKCELLQVDKSYK